MDESAWYGWFIDYWVSHQFIPDKSVPSAFNTRAQFTRSLSQSDGRRLDERYFYS